MSLAPSVLSVPLRRIPTESVSRYALHDLFYYDLASYDLNGCLSRFDGLDSAWWSRIHWGIQGTAAPASNVPIFSDSPSTGIDQNPVVRRLHLIEN